MKITFIFYILVLLNWNFAFAQSDGCSAATLISVTANCSVPISGTTIGATQTIPGCTGNADDDVWYQFTATNASHQITVTAGATFDPVVQLFSGSCAALVSLVCKDDFGSAVTETINYSGLSIGVVYRIRVYHYGIGTGSGNFTICVTNPPTAPANDNCAGATTLSVNTACVYTNGTSNGATQSSPGCSGTSDDDVWYKFVATNAVQTLTVHPLSALDMVIQVYSGTCASLSSLFCQDNTFTGQDETILLVGLVAGQTYYVRTYDYYAGTTGNFQICVSGTSTAAPINDEACNAVQIPPVTSNCQYLEFTTIGATASMTAPTPSGCVGGSAPQQGGFSSTSKDIWFAITVPSSGTIHITPEPNMGAGSITDGVMVLYSGTCAALTQIACSDDNVGYPGPVANDFMPLISSSGLTPGSTVYLRYFGWGSSSGAFGFCVTTATNDNCANALYICDINGYSASTSAAYTADRPGNMHGNNEDINGVNLVDGVNSGGIFGQSGAWGTGAPAFDVIINNNSWIKFTASSITATLQVSIFDCWVGNYPSGGIQMQIFSGTNCAAFVPVSNFEESSTGFTITANNLTIGNDYYLMVDGYAGDICNYTITAQSGVQFPDIANVPAICAGQSVTLTAPPGATSYAWQHNGATTQTVSVSPATTQTYYCEVSGLCGYKQMLDVTVTVNPNPVLSINSGNPVAICSGSSANLNATGASTYSWNTGPLGANLNVSPLSNTSYTVTGTSLGCTGTANVLVTVNANPTLSVQPTSANANCGSSNGSLSGTIATGVPSLSYTWTNGGGTTVGNVANLINIPAGVYFLNVIDGNLCDSDFGPFNVINPGAPSLPTIVVDDADPCLLSDIELIVSYSDPFATFTWSGPNGFSSSSPTINILDVDATDGGNYCVYATLAGCSGPTQCQTITILAPPDLLIGIDDSDSLICLGDSFELTVTGASSYSWTGPNGYSTNGSPISITNITTLMSGYYVVNAIDINGCSNSDSIFVQAITLPPVNIFPVGSSAVICENGIISLYASGATNYSWIGPDGYTSSSAGATLSNALEINQGWYFVNGSDLNGCNAEDSIFIDIDSDNLATASTGDSIVCPGEPILLLSSSGESFIWIGPNDFTASTANVTINSAQVFQTGWYTVYVTDTNGCSASDSAYVLVEYNADCLFIPTLFTPDTDFHNDLWVINGIENFENAEVEVYNRWGNMVYFASPYNNDWDGTVNKGFTVDGESKVPVGTYFFIIRLNNAEQNDYKGYVEVQY